MHLEFYHQGKIIASICIVDKNIITSTGPATALDVAFILLEMLTDKENVETVKQQMRFIV